MSTRPLSGCSQPVMIFENELQTGHRRVNASQLLGIGWFLSNFNQQQQRQININIAKWPKPSFSIAAGPGRAGSRGLQPASSCFGWRRCHHATHITNHLWVTWILQFTKRGNNIWEKHEWEHILGSSSFSWVQFTESVNCGTFLQGCKYESEPCKSTLFNYRVLNLSHYLTKANSLLLRAEYSIYLFFISCCIHHTTTSSRLVARALHIATPLYHVSLGGIFQRWGDETAAL